MSTLDKYGEAIVTVPTGQILAVSSVGDNESDVFKSTSPSNQPERFTTETDVRNDVKFFGPYDHEVKFKITANQNVVNYTVSPYGIVLHNGTYTAQTYAGMVAMQTASSLPPGRYRVGLIAYTYNGLVIIQEQPSSYLKSKLPKYNAALIKTKLGISNTTVAFIGDSTSVGIDATGAQYVDNYRYRLSKLISDRIGGVSVARFGNGGSTNALLISDSPEWGPLAAEWLSDGALATLGHSQLLKNISATLGTGAVYTPTEIVDTMDIWYIENAGYGTFTLSTSAGLGGTVNCAGAGPAVVKKATIALSTASTLPISFTKTVAGNIFIIGINCYLASAKKINLLPCGHGGMTSASVIGTVNAWDVLNVIKATAPDLSIIMLGINDAIAGVIDATYRANMQTLIDACKLTGDVVIATVSPCINTTASDANQLVINNAIFTLAAANNVPMIDINAEMVSYSYGNSQLYYHTDGLHFSAKGYGHIADLIINSGIFNI